MGASIVFSAETAAIVSLNLEREEGREVNIGTGVYNGKGSV